MIFNCLKDKRIDKSKVKVSKGMEFRVEKIKCEEIIKKKKVEVKLHLQAFIVSINHPKFYLFKIKSNFNDEYYYETMNKSDFENYMTNELILKL